MNENLPETLDRKEFKIAEDEYSYYTEHSSNTKDRLLKNKYDINYCISMLRQIQDHTTQYKFSRGADLALSLSYTLKKMIAHLEMERDSIS